MRNKELKNKLDQRPIDFDREALWERIESQPKKKNRAFIWWWFGGISIVVFSLLAGTYLKNTLEDKKVAKVVATNQLNSQDDEMELSNADNIQYKKEVSSGLSSEKKRSEIHKKIESEESTNLTHKDNIVSISPVDSMRLSEKKNSNNSVIFGKRNSLNKIDYIAPFADRNRSASVVANNMAEHSDITNLLDLESKDSITMTCDNIDFLFASDLSFDRPIIISNILPINSEISTFVIRPDNGLVFNFGIGSDIHQFDTDQLYKRSSVENNLESMVAQVLYQKYFSENWVVMIGLGYSTSQTNISLTSLDDGQFIRSVQDGNTYVITTETSRNLYNRYSRWDADISLGYEWQVGKWGLTPLVGRGINLKSMYDGEVINVNNDAVSLDDLELYDDRIDGYWNGKLRIDRYIDHGFKLGLMGGIESSRTLTSTDHRHSITPVSLRLQLEWLW